MIIGILVVVAELRVRAVVVELGVEHVGPLCDRALFSRTASACALAAFALRRYVIRIKRRPRYCFIKLLRYYM